MSKTAESIDMHTQEDIVERLGREIPGVRPAADDDLLDMLDSLQLLRLTVDAETLFGIRISNRDLTEANVGTLRRLANLIQTKMDHAGAHA